MKFIQLSDLSLTYVFPQTVYSWGSQFSLKQVSGSVQVVVSGSPIHLSPELTIHVSPLVAIHLSPSLADNVQLCL